MQELRHDTIIRTERDSALLRALLECDSAGNVIMRELDIAQGKLNAKVDGVKLTAPLVIGEPWRLDVKFVADSLRREIELRDKIINNFTQEERLVEVEREMKWWESALMWIGLISVIIIVVMIGYLISKLWKKK